MLSQPCIWGWNIISVDKPGSAWQLWKWNDRDYHPENTWTSAGIRRLKLLKSDRKGLSTLKQNEAQVLVLTSDTLEFTQAGGLQHICAYTFADSLRNTITLVPLHRCTQREQPNLERHQQIISYHWPATSAWEVSEGLILVSILLQYLIEIKLLKKALAIRKKGSLAPWFEVVKDERFEIFSSIHQY